jgi:hypothetical protein
MLRVSKNVGKQHWIGGGGGGGGRYNIILKPKYIKKLRICLVVLYALFAKIVVDMQNFCFFI